MGENTANTSKADAQLFNDVFHASPIGIAVENLEVQPLFMNPALCLKPGIRREEMRGNHSVDFSPPAATTTRMLIGEDCADHFAIRILPPR